MRLCHRISSLFVVAALAFLAPFAAQAACRDVLELLAADSFDRTQDQVGLALTAGNNPSPAIIDHIIKGFPGGTIPVDGNRLGFDRVNFVSDGSDPSCHIARNASFELKDGRGNALAAIPVDVYVLFSGEGAAPDGSGLEVGAPYRRGTDVVHYIHVKAGGVIAQSGTRVPSAGPHVDRGKGNWTYARWTGPVAGSDAAFSLVLCAMPCDRAIRSGLAAPVPPAPVSDAAQTVDDDELRELFPLAENDPDADLNACAAALRHVRRDPVDSAEDEVGFALLMNADPSPVLTANSRRAGGAHLPGDKVVVTTGNVRFRPERGGDPRCHSAQSVNFRVSDARRRSTILSQIPVDVFVYFRAPATVPQRNQIAVSALGAGPNGAVHTAAVSVPGKSGTLAGASGKAAQGNGRMVRWARPMPGSSALFTLVLCEGDCDAFQPANSPEQAIAEAVVAASEVVREVVPENPVSVSKKARPRDAGAAASSTHDADMAALTAEIARLDARIARMEAQQAAILAELQALKAAAPSPQKQGEAPDPPPGGGLKLVLADNGSPLRVAPRNVRSMRLSVPRAEDCSAVGAWFERTGARTREDAFFVRDGSQLRLCKRTGPNWIVVPARESSRAHVVEEK